jgi:shikimate kinase
VRISPWIFDVEGEEGFRDREEQVIDEMTLLDHTVLATGGGVVLREATGGAASAVLSSTCTLRSKSSCGARAAIAIAPCWNRADPEQVLRRLFRERDPLYREHRGPGHREDSSSPG